MFNNLHNVRCLLVLWCRDLGCLTKLGSLHRRQWTAPQWSQQHRCHLWLSGRLETKVWKIIQRLLFQSKCTHNL